MMREMLLRMGYLSIVCARPKDALALFSRASTRFDAVIVDELMPNVRGTELAAQLLDVRSDIPIILATGHGNILSLENIWKSGVRATHIKPVHKENLQVVLSVLLT